MSYYGSTRVLPITSQHCALFVIPSVINDQYVCTAAQLRNSTCKGGIMDIVELISRKTAGGQDDMSDYSCR